MTRLILFIFCASWLIPAQASPSPWWHDDWGFKKEFSINTTASGLTLSSALEDVLVLVRLHAGNFSYFSDVKLSAEDVRFVSNQNQLLAHHTEYFNADEQIGLFWVRIPQIKPNRTQKFTLYYGSDNSEHAIESSGSSSDDRDILVYHFNNNVQDASNNSHHLTSHHPTETITTYVQGAAIGSGIEFLGDQYLSTVLSPSLSLSTSESATMSMWSKIDAPQKNATLLAMSDQDNNLQLRIQGQQLFIEHMDAQLQQTQLMSLDAELKLNTWHHLALSIDHEMVTLYVNAQAHKVKNTLPVDSIQQISIGGSKDTNDIFLGQIDEFRIQNLNAVHDWISLAYVNQGSNDILINAGADIQRQSVNNRLNPLMFSISKLSLEGKITSTILMFMLILGLNIMFFKGLFIYRVKKANRLFIEAFSLQTTKPVDVPDSIMSYSSLNNIHKQALKELDNRIAHNATLSDQALATIKAAMNTVMLRETQKLNKQMVLLTIAIAGGPFIGLLGTVMGVMITFADVALAGNVDVNAIAPGISAALVATVAGLLVAIPCLFGYNYLSSQIKEIVSDMRVFIDQYLASINERYIG